MQWTAWRAGWGEVPARKVPTCVPTPRRGNKGECAPFESTGVAGGVPEQISGSLKEFVAALRSGQSPESTALANIHSLAMVFSATRAADTGERVDIEGVRRQALADAIATEQDSEVIARLREL